MTVDPTVAERLGRDLLVAIEAGDVDTIRNQLYAEDTVIWHNTDGLAQTPDENLRTLRWLCRTFSDVRYEEVRRQPTPSGYVQQHVLRVTTPEGERVELPACLVVTVVGDRISRLDEYLDSAGAAQLRRFRP